MCDSTLTVGVGEEKKRNQYVLGGDSHPSCFWVKLWCAVISVFVRTSEGSRVQEINRSRRKRAFLEKSNLRPHEHLAGEAHRGPGQWQSGAAELDGDESAPGFAMVHTARRQHNDSLRCWRKRAGLASQGNLETPSWEQIWWFWNVTSLGSQPFS